MDYRTETSPRNLQPLVNEYNKTTEGFKKIFRECKSILSWNRALGIITIFLTLFLFLGFICEWNRNLLFIINSVTLMVTILQAFFVSNARCFKID